MLFLAIAEQGFTCDYDYCFEEAAFYIEGGNYCDTHAIQLMQDMGFNPVVLNYIGEPMSYDIYQNPYWFDTYQRDRRKSIIERG